MRARCPICGLLTEQPYQEGAEAYHAKCLVKRFPDSVLHLPCEEKDDEDIQD